MGRWWSGVWIGFALYKIESMGKETNRLEDFFYTGVGRNDTPHPRAARYQ